LALANLKRIDMERRSALLEADLKAAATAQQWILPQRQGHIGPFRYSGESRPGRHVGGDFFDIIPLKDDRLAIAIGDVSGKGVTASVLMTTAQGFLHAALEESGDPQHAVTRLNHFIHERSESNKFVTLWVGVLCAAGDNFTAGLDMPKFFGPTAEKRNFKEGNVDAFGLQKRCGEPPRRTRNGRSHQWQVETKHDL